MTNLEDSIAKLLPIGTKMSEGDLFSHLWGKYDGSAILKAVRALERERLLIRRYYRDPDGRGVRSAFIASQEFLGGKGVTRLLSEANRFLLMQRNTTDDNDATDSDS